MSEKQYEDRQVALDVYAEYLTQQIIKQAPRMDIEDMEKICEDYNITNKYKEERE